MHVRSSWYSLTVISLLVAASTSFGAELTAFPDYLRPDPFGNVVAIDRNSTAVPSGAGTAHAPFVVAGARGGYVSFHLVVKMPEGGDFNLSVTIEDKTARLKLDFYREWFHLVEADKNYYPDALVPATLPFKSRIPDPENRVDHQTSAAFWMDVWIPKDAVPGSYRCMAALQTQRKKLSLPVELKVLAGVIPDEDAIQMDHNSYGSSFLAEHYPGTVVPSEESFRLTRLYHRIFYEHRGGYHQLGYGHGGKVIQEFAPELAGSGRQRHIANWDLYDRHYGPLLDGSAFSDSRRGPRPIPYVYLPINPEWPASFLWWGEPGYEAEFTNVVSQMEKHFREKGWTQTRFEMFFNHKKRYKAFPWDGDEVRFPDDDSFFIEYGRLLKKALPPDTPVKFVYRTDSSWSMENQFKTLAGIINFWVCGGDMLTWYPEAAKTVKARGDIVWIYGGPPAINRVSSTITMSAMKAWIMGIDGWVHWQTVEPGADPWFHSDGGGIALVYPGDRFGIRGPIPSVRLKLQRNGVQDITLLDSMKIRHPLDALKAEATKHYNGTSPSDWWSTRPALADGKPYEWSNGDIDEAVKATERVSPAMLTAAAWENVHQFIMKKVAEEK